MKHFHRKMIAIVLALTVLNAGYALAETLEWDKLGLGTLTSDQSGISDAKAVSADGKVVVGMSFVGHSHEDSKGFHAFKYTEGNHKLTDLGSLKRDNTGNSYIGAVSADGKVVIGQATGEYDDLHAYRHREGDLKMTDLGTLKRDNSGDSFVLTISADGRTVAGWSDIDSEEQTTHAFRHNEGDLKLTDLGTLASDNSGESRATAVSADGKVVVGESDVDSGGGKPLSSRAR